MHLVVALGEIEQYMRVWLPSDFPGSLIACARIEFSPLLTPAKNESFAEIAGEGDARPIELIGSQRNRNAWSNLKWLSENIINRFNRANKEFG